MAQQQYDREKTGPLAPNFLEAGCFVKSRPDVEISDLQLFLFGNLTPDSPEAGTPARHGIALTAYVNSPCSMGQVYLTSADPLDRPRIDPNYFSDPDDLRCRVAGMRWNLNILYTGAFDGVRDLELLPGSDIRDGEGLAEFVIDCLNDMAFGQYRRMAIEASAVVDPESDIVLSFFKLPRYTRNPCRYNSLTLRYCLFPNFPGSSALCPTWIPS